MTKAGWSYDMEWFYRPEYPPKVKTLKSSSVSMESKAATP
jgi:hypothetical protein